MNIYGEYAHKYLAKGLSVMPVVGKGVPVIREFTPIAEHGIDDELLDTLAETHPEKNIGLLMGGKSGLVGFDLDYDGERASEYEAMVRAILPPIAIEKIGRKGFTAFFSSDLKSSKKTKSDRVGDKIKVTTFFEILSTGRYTIIPPSIHPDIDRAYYWSKNNLLEFDLENLPNLNQETVDALVMATDKFFGLAGEEKSSGRNNSLWGYAYKSAKSFGSYNAWKNAIIEYDRKLFADNSWFEETAKEKRKPVDDVAEYYCQAWFKSLKPLYKKHYNVDFSFGVSVDEVPTSGFYTNTQDDESKKPRWAPLYREAAEFYRDSKKFCFSDAFSYHYKNGYWHWLEEGRLDKVICDSSKDHWLPQHIGLFKKGIKALSNYSNFDFKDTEGIINLNNGVLDVKKRLLMPHSTDYFFKGKLSVDYNPNARCDTFLNCLDFILSGDADRISIIQKMFGYVLIGGYPFLHKAFILYGDGRNGKSTVLDALRMIIGKENYTSVPLNLINRPFSAVQLDGKIANIVGENQVDGISSEIFKAAVGGEAIPMSHKGRDEYQMDVTARFIIACNDLPYFGDKSMGIKDRLILIPFDRYIPEGERDTRMREKIAGELSGILNWALDGATQVTESREIKSSNSEILEEIKNEFNREADSVLAFFQDCIQVNASGMDILASLLYQHYCDYCLRVGRRSLGMDKMSKSFTKVSAAAYKAIGINDGRVRKVFPGKTMQSRGYQCLIYDADLT